MPLLYLTAVSGGDADANINVQNGNIYFLKQIYNLPFQNFNGDTIDVNAISILPNIVPDDDDDLMTIFTNANNNTTQVITVDIPLQFLNYTIVELNKFKGSHSNVNFFQIVGEGDIIDPNPLNVDSLLKAIEVIWFTFHSNLVYKSMYHDIVNLNQPNSHPYVNRAYNYYMLFYNGQVEDGDLCYIHPHLFPFIFYYVFTNNIIPMSIYENGIDPNNYNNTIWEHNGLYINDQKTILCIYRNPVVPQIMNLKAIHAQLKNNMKEGMPMA